MKIIIQSPSFHPSDKLLDFANDKVSKLKHYSDQIMEAQVLMRVDKSDVKSNKLCEIRLTVPGNDLFARRQSPSFEDAVLKTVEALKQQLISWKEKNARQNACSAH
jgi:putative sigma-54 modulation protein